MKTIYIPVIFFVLCGCNRGLCQSLDSAADIQSFLNQFCLRGSDNAGCTNASVIRSPDVAVPRPTPSPVPTFPSPPVSGPLSCPANEKPCPQLRTKCVPNNVDCGVINSGVRCSIPQAFGVETQVLICGDDTRVGFRCGNSRDLPVLTLLMVQCQGANLLSPRSVASFGVLLSPDDGGGAGVYQCSAQGTWQPKENSPSLNLLTASCRNAGCGRIPHPTPSMPVFRRWSWVRGIYKAGTFHCTGTLVSQNAIITAAHCVTRSTVSNDIDPNIDDYDIELPGINILVPFRKVKPEQIFIHPRYDYNNQEFRYDMAVVFFNIKQPQAFPTVCVTDRLYVPERGRHQVVFDYMSGQQRGGIPRWWYRDATWDHTCLSTSIRFNSRCRDTVQVQTSQFCASHEGISLNGGSSGGPYLVEVGQDSEEVWVLMGVLSSSKRISADDCSQAHSVYGEVADDSRWVLECVFYRRCNF